jgi:hypothetical protein
VCHISIKSEGAALQDWILVGGIRMSYKRFNADSLRTVISPKKVLEMGVLHYGLISYLVCIDLHTSGYEFT